MLVHLRIIRFKPLFCLSVQTTHPAERSPEWIEALHEMGWEHYNPLYVGHYEAYIPDDNSNEWIEIDVGNVSRYGSRERDQDELWDVADDTPPVQTIRIY